MSQEEQDNIQMATANPIATGAQQTAPSGSSAPPTTKPTTTPMDHDGTVEGATTNAYKNKPERNECIKYCLIGIRYIQQIHLKNSSWNNIMIAQEAASIFRSVHEKLRKSNGIISEEGIPGSALAKECTTSVLGVETKYNGAIIAIELKKIALKHFAFDYTIDRKSNPNNWFSTMSPVVTFMSTFKNRIEELRLGTTTFVSGKRQADKAPIKGSLKMLGFEDHHAPLFEGISYPPEIRGTMLKSLGPGTQLVCLMKNTDATYVPKYTKVLNETFKMLPNIEAVWRVMVLKPNAEITRAILRVLLDIALIATARNHHRGTPPVSMLYSLLTTEQYAEFIVTDGFTNTENKIILESANIESFDFSSIGLFTFMASLKNEKYLFPEMDLETARQIVYHASYGTHFEDLSILAQLTTNATWMSRQQMGNVFQKLGSKTTVVEITPIVNTKASKFRSALLTDILPKSQIQMISTPVFAGRRKVEILKIFIETMEKDSTANVAKTDDANEIYKSLRRIKHCVLSTIRETGIILQGTVSWFNVPAEYPLTSETVIVRDDTVLEGKNTYFNELDKSLRTKFEPDTDKNKDANKKREKALEDL